MRKEITLDEADVAHILKKHFRLKTEPTLYFSGGMFNPPKINMVYYESK